MSWNPNIPQPTDALSQSQADILANFQALDALFDGGIQDFVIFPQQSSQPTTSSTEVALYSALDSGSNIQLFYGPKSTGTPINLTGSGAASSGWAYLPSGILLKWGSGSGSGSFAVSFPLSPAPAFNNIFSIQISVAAANTSPSPSTPPDLYAQIWQYTTTGFQAYLSKRLSTSSAIVPFTYFAIGN